MKANEPLNVAVSMTCPLPFDLWQVYRKFAHEAGVGPPSLGDEAVPPFAELELHRGAPLDDGLGLGFDDFEA